MKLPKLIDLTHALTPNMPTWDGCCGFSLQQLLGDSLTSDINFTIQEIAMPAGAGTHIDAPAHCFQQEKSIDKIEVGELLSPCIVIDISDSISENLQLSVESVKKWEQKFSRIKNETFIFVHTGWGKFFGDSRRYRNNLIFPSVHQDAAAYLLERGARGLGIDTLSPDLPQSGFPVHNIMLGAGKFIVENVANLHLMPAQGAAMLALPLKIKNGTEAPARVVGLLST